MAFGFCSVELPQKRVSDLAQCRLANSQAQRIRNDGRMIIGATVCRLAFLDVMTRAEGRSQLAAIIPRVQSCPIDGQESPTQLKPKLDTSFDSFDNWTLHLAHHHCVVIL